MQDTLMLTTDGGNAYLLLDDFGGQRGGVFASVAAAVAWAAENGLEVEPDQEITGEWHAYCVNR